MSISSSISKRKKNNGFLNKYSFSQYSSSRTFPVIFVHFLFIVCLKSKFYDALFSLFRHVSHPMSSNISNHRHAEKGSHELRDSCINSPRTWESIVMRISVCKEIAFLPQKAPNCAGDCTLLINSRIPVPSQPLTRDNPGNRVTRGWADLTMQILLRADSTTNGSGSIKTWITMLEHQVARIRTSRCIIHALYAYNSYIRALTYRKQRRQLYSIYSREYCALEEIARIFPLPGTRITCDRPNCMPIDKCSSISHYTISRLLIFMLN